MTLEEYEKLLEEKRKALQALKTEERRVDTKVFESMQQLSKKSSDEIFVKLVKFSRRSVICSCLMPDIFNAFLDILLCHDFRAPRIREESLLRRKRRQRR